MSLHKLSKRQYILVCPLLLHHRHYSSVPRFYYLSWFTLAQPWPALLSHLDLLFTYLLAKNNVTKKQWHQWNLLIGTTYCTRGVIYISVLSALFLSRMPKSKCGQVFYSLLFTLVNVLSRCPVNTNLILGENYSWYYGCKERVLFNLAPSFCWRALLAIGSNKNCLLISNIANNTILNAVRKYDC